MLYDPSPDAREKLAKRLAKKAGLPSDHARKFLDALHEVMSEEEHEHNVAGHALSIPLVQQADGTILVDTSGYSTLWPFRIFDLVAFSLAEKATAFSSSSHASQTPHPAGSLSRTFGRDYQGERLAGRGSKTG
jgi:hypothetical protein